jgi:hypothetical protein
MGIPSLCPELELGLLRTDNRLIAIASPINARKSAIPTAWVAERAGTDSPRFSVSVSWACLLLRSDGTGPRGLEEEPGAPLRLVDPHLDEARGGDVAVLAAQVVGLPKPRRKLLVASYGAKDRFVEG